MRNIKLYLKYFGIHIYSQTQYKVSFFLMLFGQFIFSFTTVFEIYFMLNLFYKVEGFSYDEILLCFSIILMAYGIAEFFYRGFDTFSTIISNGEFDRMLVRPKGLIFQVLCSQIDFVKIGRIAAGGLVLIYAMKTSDVIWTHDKILTLTFMIFGGVFLFSALFLIYASICFFTIEGLEFMNIFTDGGRDHGKYPLSIYGQKVLKFFTYIVPLACVQYYPLMYLVGKTSNKYYTITPVAAVIFYIIAYILWKIGVKNYKSIGS